MNRNKLLTMLQKYGRRFPTENFNREFPIICRWTAALFRKKLLVDGHVTASSLVLNEPSPHTLLTRHAKLRKWLQLGGHCDGDSDPLRVAQREAMEESGLDVDPVTAEVLDLDIHRIPAPRKEPAHYHYDVRFALRIKGSDAYRISCESLDLQWVR
ncbi:MAG: hypothetical protein Ct9H300mP8_00360 [Gammaproteobacteria bacterium]|nr:MAG: hypothetical protein Ct9H300mP8_00360 [Gammaproteobacteria bacterium]